MPFDKTKYPPDWSSISSRIRFTRAHNRCELCGAKNYDIHPLTGKRVILTVAHLNHDTTDNRDENLLALCQSCHLNHDRGDNNKRKRYGKEYAQNPKIPFNE